MRKRTSPLRSLRGKITLSLLSIAAILLLSSIISVLEFRRMSNYVSNLIDSNLNSIAVTGALEAECESYNLEILDAIGENRGDYSAPYFDVEAFLFKCDSLKTTFSGEAARSAIDSIRYSFTGYMLASEELQDVIKSDFINSREWYFGRLQPRFVRFRDDVSRLSTLNYDLLKDNSLSFEDNFYRSIAPSLVAVSAALILVLLLLYFILDMYVKPLGKMLSALRSYRENGKSYNYTFEGDDELRELNDGITDVVQSNSDLRRRVAALNKKLSDM